MGTTLCTSRHLSRDGAAVPLTYKSLTTQQLRWLKRRQAVEPAIGHLKLDYRMDRCWPQGELGDALHIVLCATGLNLRWLLRAMVRLGLKAIYLRQFLLALQAAVAEKEDRGAYALRSYIHVPWCLVNFAGPTITTLPCTCQVIDTYRFLYCSGN
jgi:IS5 family transposase